MSSVEFDEQKDVPVRQSAKNKDGMSEFLIRLKLAKNNAEAQLVLLGVLGVVVVLTIFIFFTFALPATPQPVPL